MREAMVGYSDAAQHKSVEVDAVVGFENSPSLLYTLKGGKQSAETDKMRLIICAVFLCRDRRDRNRSHNE